MSQQATISGRQRNLLYKPVLDYLSVANDAYLVARAGRYEEADRLGRQTCEELAFVLTDLGWRERRADEVIQILTPPPIVRRVVGRVLEETQREVFEGTQAEIQKLEKESRDLRSACEAVLAALPSGGAPDCRSLPLGADPNA